MKSDHAGALRMNPADAARLRVTDGDAVRVETKRASAVATVEVTDTLQEGHVSLPNGRGVSYPDDDGDGSSTHGVAPNELTSDDDRDWLALTPHHKHVRARISALVDA